MKKGLAIAGVVLLCLGIIFLVLTYEEPKDVIEQSSVSATNPPAEATTCPTVEPDATSMPTLGDLVVGGDYEDKLNKEDENTPNLDFEEEINPIDIRWDKGSLTQDEYKVFCDYVCAIYVNQLETSLDSQVVLTWEQPSEEELQKFQYKVLYYQDLDNSMVLHLHLNITVISTGESYVEVKALRVKHTFDGLELIY